jgi:hypothetical protein
MPFLTNPAGRFCFFKTPEASGGGGGTAIRFDVSGVSGADQFWTAPTGVYSVTVELYGGNGGKEGAIGNFGKGGYVRGTLAVEPGDIFTLIVGQAGGNTWPIYGGGGKGFSTANGGGRTAIRKAGVELATAGGGGGGADAYFGGDGGGPVGQTPSYGDDRDGTPPTGGSTTDSAGGAGGTYIYAIRNGSDGTQFYGGDCGDPYGGGGGSGYYGGGGGASQLQPGAGGSSYTGGLTGTIVSTQGVGGDMTVGGNGYIIITIPD